MPQGGHRGLRARFYNRENRRPQGLLGATRGKSEGRGASPRPQAQDLAGGFQRTRPIVATVAAMAPNAKVASGRNTTQRSAASTPEGAGRHRKNRRRRTSSRFPGRPTGASGSLGRRRATVGSGSVSARAPGRRG